MMMGIKIIENIKRDHEGAWGHALKGMAISPAHDCHLAMWAGLTEA